METSSICSKQDLHLWYSAAQHIIFALVFLLELIPALIACMSPGRKKKKKTSDLTYADFEKSCAGTRISEEELCLQE